MSLSKEKIRKYYDNEAEKKSFWQKRSSYYYKDIAFFTSFNIEPGSRVLELGCATGNLLDVLQRKGCHCTGIDFSAPMISRAKKKFPKISFIHVDAEDFKLNQKFDYVIFSDVLNSLTDIQKTFENIRQCCQPSTRIIITYYNFLWEPIFKIARSVRMISPVPEQSWLSPFDIENLLTLADFDIVKSGKRMLLPMGIPLLAPLMNKYLARLPLIEKLCVYNFVIARPINLIPPSPQSVSVVIAARNEKGNIENAIKRLPKMGSKTELIFIEGGSTDGTYEEILRVAEKYKDTLPIKVAKQGGKGKGDAVRKGFDMASNDILMILDADLTMPPEDLPKFYDAINSNKGEFINGCRLVYPMESEAMRSINRFGNKMFSIMFTWILGQKFRDTLCGTKVLTKKNYEILKKNRYYFGDFDPFGDFDLIFGASKMNLKIIEVPIRYKDRLYGSTNISRFIHGFILIRMCLFAMRKIKFY